MENASKALIMAGGVLISLLVISLLVVFYNNVKDLKGTQTTVEITEQAAEFNKQFDVYARDVYGSDILSLANKIDNYNKTEGSDDKQYTKIELNVILERDIDSKIFKKGTYTAEQINAKILELENYVEEKGNTSIKSKTNSRVSRKISQIASMRTKDLEDLGIQSADYNSLLVEYNTYKSLVTQIKSKIFKYSNFEYDKNTGRITKMIYKYS